MAVRYGYFAATALALLAACQGCKSLPPSDASAWGEARWGPSVEGLQCRLRAERPTWRSNETPAFNFDLRNRGKRTFAFWPAQKLELAEIEFDGKWHRWPSDVMTNSPVWPLAPGSQYNAVTIQLDKHFKIDIKPGKHIVRIAYSLEGVWVVSNPVGIKIVAAG
ncbi:MAG: hypothetical protein JXN61_02680 [Sedimentisphaerales bacterium]|nr:hypothetical protein [Sedimentisphaerales bacterium]